MAGRTSALGAAEFADEAAWAEVSTTYDQRLAVTNQIDASGLVQEHIETGRTVQYQNEGTAPFAGPKSGSFRTEFWLPGHGVSTASGTPTVKDHETVLGYVLGTTTTSGAATTASGGTATSMTTAAASGLTPGGIVWVGVDGDGRGDGQPTVVSAHGSSTLDVLVGIPAAPSGTDAVTSAVNVHTIETPSSAGFTSLRWRLLTADQQYACRGCCPTALEISGLNPGESAKAMVDWYTSIWDPVSATFPSTVSVDAYNPASNGGGSLFIAARGTATRSGNTYSCRSFSMSINLGTVTKPGPDGIDPLQTIVAAIRSPMEITFRIVVDSDSATASPTWPGKWDTNAQMHMLYGLNNSSTGKRMAIYAPNAYITGRKPVQSNRNGINSEEITLVARANTAVTTSELTLSAVRIAFG